jgi:uncharacterized protein YgbK (DUF1537 family)
VRLAIVDAITDADLEAIGEACAAHALVTGGSGVAIGLPSNFRRAGLLPLRNDAAMLPNVAGAAAIVSGSCSNATRAQVAHWIDHGKPAVRIDPIEAERYPDLATRVVDEAKSLLASTPVLFYATSTPDRVREVQAALGVERAGAVIEATLARIARRLVDDAGVGRFIVAGGETSGAAVQALGIRALRIGEQIEPGVPWTMSVDARPILLALKSGNFGGADFFERAFAMLTSLR